ncbi:MAG TPA: hypothetical protein VIV11_26720 [Kofleriaceae bacterium]
MRTVLLSLVVLAGCVADGVDEPPPPVESEPQVDVSLMTPQDDAQVDVCALAALLPSEDICSLICDPAAMAERMVSDGNDRGTCYQLYCSLTTEEHVLVGVCLPP